MKTKFKYLVIILSLALLWNPLLSQDLIYVYMEFSTWKYNDNSRGLVTKILMDGDEGEIAVEGVPVKYYTLNEGENELIAEVISDQDGIAKAIFPPDYQFPKDEDGYITVTSSFEGTDKYDIAEEELMFIDANINFSFDVVDEENVIVFEGKIYSSDNEELPLADDDLYFYVPRMFSDLKIADGWFEENGKGYVEFPSDIIGDSVGQVMVYAKILEHGDYGNIVKSAMCNWAIPMHPHLRQGPGRELWTPIAPLWMIITLIITLSGVWGHYIYAIVQLRRIKRLSRKQKK
ncbi:hypothetical protein ACFLRY_04840 [Bacteroidota bacterium]